MAFVIGRHANCNLKLVKQGSITRKYLRLIKEMFMMDNEGPNKAPWRYDRTSE